MYKKVSQNYMYSTQRLAITSTRPRVKICIQQGSKFIFGFESICATRCKIFRRTAEILGTEFKILGAQLQILGAPTPKN